jgi:FKBP-type peptidyl-prolyl cis-trans isomerase SlyD
MQVDNDKVVSFHFTLTDDQGGVIESTHSQAPMAYLHGRGNLIPGLEQALAGKGPGDTFDITLRPEDAYGEHDSGLVQRINRDEFPPDAGIAVGSEFQVEDEKGLSLVTITEIDEDDVTIDGNHPLAGETISFKVQVVEIREATDEELTHGHVHGPEGHHH